MDNFGYETDSSDADGDWDNESLFSGEMLPNLDRLSLNPYRYYFHRIFLIMLDNLHSSDDPVCSETSYHTVSSNPLEPEMPNIQSKKCECQKCPEVGNSCCCCQSFLKIQQECKGTCYPIFLDPMISI